MKKLIFAFSVAGMFVGCSPKDFFDRQVDAYDLQYVERLVVQGKLIPDQSVDTIFISRTLPLTEKYVFENAALNNVEASITAEGQTFALRTIGIGRYDVPGFIPKEGKEYTLHVQWQDKKVSATTTVPYRVPIDTVLVTIVHDTSRYGSYTYIDSFYRADVIFKPIGNQVYTAQQSDSGYGSHSSNPLGNYRGEAIKKEVSDDGRMHIRGRLYYAYPERPETLQRVKIILTTLDYRYYDFSVTYHKFHDDPFGNGGQTVAWNVQGDGIGLFIGKATTEKKISQ